MLVKTKLHILALQKLLKEHKLFLTAIARCKTPHQRRTKVQKATKKELNVVQQLICAFLRQEIGISKYFLSRLKRTKKYNIIVKHFQKLGSAKNLRENLIHIANVLPLFIRVILKKPTT